MALDNETNVVTGRPSASLPAKTRRDNGVMAVPYAETTPAERPISITVPLRAAPSLDVHPALRPRPNTGEEDEEERKRDSGLAPTTSSITMKEGSLNTVDEGGRDVDKEGGAEASNTVLGNHDPALSPKGTSAERTSLAPSVPTTPITSKPESVRSASLRSPSIASSSMHRWKRPLSRKSSGAMSPGSIDEIKPVEAFKPIVMDIPTEKFVEEDFMQKVEFSKRGSIMVNLMNNPQARPRTEAGRKQPPKLPTIKAASLNVRMLEPDQEMESRRVRSLYEPGFDGDENEDGFSGTTSEIGTVEEEPQPLDNFLSPVPNTTANRPNSAISSRSIRSIRSARGEHELAGGLEDWEDINGEDVDRYGFISPSKELGRAGSPESRPPVQRTSTALELAASAPRQRRIFSRQSSLASRVHRRTSSRKVTAKSVRTQSSRISQRSSRSIFRSTTNRLTGNRNRRWMDEAGDMLTLPPGLAAIAEDAEGGKAALNLKKKEWSRAEKWRKMAKVVKPGKDGEGMQFEFDTQSPKLIERTWKGIPDRWRASAWYSFLSASAKKKGDMPSDTEIVDTFYALLDQSSADDVQIDLDVPRTINRHIMFRKRYRGGQRLLFRVLHSLSLYFPDTGYVQGMASLAATLLCYFDEEKAFVMLVRMWKLRGMDKLYEAGFPGLMAALDEFNKVWLDGRPVAKRLESMNIDPTAFGTRWYLTLFNYSIPFQAQLRVWDVFLLLGDSDPSITATPERPFAGGLDVLHATAAALIDGTNEILMDSDFENAMKVLTSWIPIRDEELLMKVAKGEWKMRKEKKKAG